MSQFESAVPPQVRETNGLGIAGFVISLVGVAGTGGLLCPVGLIVSLIALGKQPRGFAVAGIVLGALGTCGGLAMFLLFGAAILAMLGLATAVVLTNPQSLELTADMMVLAAEVDAYRTDAFPFVMWIGDRDEEYVGIFPIPPGGTPALKVLGEQFITSTHPDSVDRHVSDAEIKTFYRRHVQPRLVGVSPTCVKAEVCLYTNTPDDHFLIDTSSTSDLITLMSPCSGHGFKHSAALGEAVVEQIVSGAANLDLAPFRRGRLNV